jgi:hypothetical protein
MVVMHLGWNLRLDRGTRMTFKIGWPDSEETAIVLRVCGWVDIECLNTLKELIEAENGKIALDLSEVMLANRDAGTFFAVCELKGIELRNCPAFLRLSVAPKGL